MSENKRYKVFPKYIEEEKRNNKHIRIKAEGLYMQLDNENEEEIKKKLEEGIYELIYIGTYSIDHGMWAGTWYQPIEVYTSSIPKNICEKEYGGVQIEGLCFHLKHRIGIWRRELLIYRDTEPRLFETAYLFYEYFEVAPSKS